MTVVNKGKWIQIFKGRYRGDFGFLMHMEAGGAHLLISHLKAPTPEEDTSLKRK